MKAFLDTSVLVPAFLGDHPHHGPSLDLLARCVPTDAACAAHSLLEVYSVLTRMPGKHRVTSDQALLFVGNLREHLSLVALTAEESVTALEQFAATGVSDGAIYDAHIAACALKSRAKALYTWNIGQFSRLGSEIIPLLRTPGHSDSR